MSTLVWNFIFIIISVGAGALITFIAGKIINRNSLKGYKKSISAIDKWDDRESYVRKFKRSYRKASKTIQKFGSLMYTGLIVLFTLCDVLNFFSSFDSIYTESIFILVILSATVSIIIDFIPAALGEYVFRPKEIEISESTRKLMRFIIIIGIGVIVLMIAILFKLRFSIIGLVFDGDDVPDSAARAMTFMWSALAGGTTISSFAFTAINKTVLTPMLIKDLKHEYSERSKDFKCSLQCKNIESEHMLPYISKKIEDDPIFEAEKMLLKAEGALDKLMRKDLQNSGSSFTKLADVRRASETAPNSTMAVNQ